MAKTTLEDLREHLFATLEGLRDEDDPLPVDRAKAICEVAGRVIETGKLEVDFLRLTEEEPGSSFFQDGNRNRLGSGPRPRAIGSGGR